MFLKISNRLVLCLVLTISALSSPLSALGQADPKTRPPTQDLLPETTVLFVQLDDFKDFATKMRESSFGKMYQDEAIAPLVEGLWDEAKIAYDDVKDEVGLSIEDITALPSGEMTFAVIAPRRKNPEFMMILELDDESEALDRVLDRGRELIKTEAGEEISVEKTDDGFDIESFNADGKTIKFFRKDGLIVGCTSEDELNAFIDRWMGREVKKVRPFSENRKFITIMNRCKGTKEIKPEARFFVDPIALTKSATRGEFTAQAGLALLPIFGLDGLLGAGGSMLLSEDDFESVVHAHLLLANPRKGVFEMISLKPTSYDPEPWIPHDAVSYLTTSWDIDQMMTELAKIVNTVSGDEGMLERAIEENVNQNIQLDLKADILDHLTGRVTLAQWVIPPMKFNSQVNVLAFELKDPEAIKKSLETLVELANTQDDEDAEDRVESTEYKGVQIWAQSEERMNNRLDRQRERQAERRKERGDEREPVEMDINMPRPAFAIVDNYLMISFERPAAIEHAIDANQGDIELLVHNEEYASTAKKMARLLKTDMPCAMAYQNPKETIRGLVEYAKSENAKSMLSRGAEGNKYLAGIKGRLDDNPLPDFDKLEKYFRPAGWYMTSDDTGYHVLAFSERAEDTDDGK